MNAFKERLLENDLAEMLGGKRPPDLVQSALARLRGEEAPQAETPSAKPVLSIRPYFRLLEAACIVLTLGGIVWLLWPDKNPEPLPEGVVVSRDAQYSVSKAAIKFDKGWLMLKEGAPVTVVGETYVSEVKGRVLLRTGVAPTADELAAISAELPSDLTDMERKMVMNPRSWIVAGAVAICVFAGSAKVNGEHIRQHVEVDIQYEEPKPEPKPGPKPNAKHEEFKVLRTYSGELSAIREREFHWVANADDLKTIWFRHDKRAAMPEVDWSKERVVAIFMGKSANQFAFEAKAYRAEDRYVIRFGNYAAHDPAQETTAYGFVVVPNTPCRIELQQNVQDSADLDVRSTTPIWEYAHMLDQGAGAVPGLKVGEGVAKSYTCDDTKYFKPNARYPSEPVCQRLTTAEAFDQLWQLHAPNTAKPWDVDFKKHAVIAVLYGETMNSRGIKLEDTLVDARTLVLRINNDLNLERSAASYSKPCAFFLVPKEKSVIVEAKGNYKTENGETVVRGKDDPERYITLAVEQK